MAENRRTFILGAVSAVGVANAAEPQPPQAVPVLDSEKFRAAVAAGDIAAVNKYLDGDPGLLYARDAHGNSVYTLACLAGQTKTAEALAARGLVLDIFEAAVSGNIKRATELSNATPGIARARSADGRTPLHFAAAGGQPDMVMFLNSRGADLSAGPESPLLAAVDYPDLAVALESTQTLAGNASDPNAKRKDGKSALHLAAARGNGPAARLLIHRGAVVEAVDIDAATGDAVAVLKNAATIERAYYGRRYTQDAHGNPVTRDDTNGLPQDFINQFITFAHFDFDKVKQLYKLCPALLTTRATWDELAVEASAHMGRVDMAEYLADLGSPVSACTAAMLGMADNVKSIIKADTNCLRERGAHDLPLLAYTAFGKERVEIAAFLLDAGADIHTRGFGQTVLHFAAARGHLDLAKLLLERGADVNAASKGGTPLAAARRSKMEKMAQFLSEHGGRA
jgi:uncharacterized protein